MLYEKINENGIFIDRFQLDEMPNVEIEGELVPDKTFIPTPIPNNIYMELGFSPQWTGTEWIATAERPEPTPNPPTVEERLEMAEIAILEMMME